MVLIFLVIAVFCIFLDDVPEPFSTGQVVNFLIKKKFIACL